MIHGLVAFVGDQMTTMYLLGAGLAATVCLVSTSPVRAAEPMYVYCSYTKTTGSNQSTTWLTRVFPVAADKAGGVQSAFRAELSRRGMLGSEENPFYTCSGGTQAEAQQERQAVAGRSTSGSWSIQVSQVDWIPGGTGPAAPVSKVGYCMVAVDRVRAGAGKYTNLYFTPPFSTRLNGPQTLREWTIYLETGRGDLRKDGGQIGAPGCDVWEGSMEKARTLIEQKKHERGGKEAAFGVEWKPSR